MTKTKTGTVVSHNGAQTAIVRIDRMVPHLRYGKMYRVSKRYAVHDAENRAKVGETVTICETKPISKTKTWKLVDQKETK